MLKIRRHVLASASSEMSRSPWNLPIHLSTSFHQYAPWSACSEHLVGSMCLQRLGVGRQELKTFTQAGKAQNEAAASHGLRGLTLSAGVPRPRSHVPRFHTRAEELPRVQAKGKAAVEPMEFLHTPGGDRDSYCRKRPYHESQKLSCPRGFDLCRGPRKL